jgi:hypothetical protein
VDKTKLAAAFNEWMRRYTENPEQFEREFVIVTRFMNEKNSGVEPSYGEICAAYLTVLVEEIEKSQANA